MNQEKLWVSLLGVGSGMDSGRNGLWRGHGALA